MERTEISKTIAIGLALAVGLAVGIAGGGRVLTSPAEAQTQTAATLSFSAVPGAIDRLTHKMLKYDLDGRLIYSWGTVGDFPGTLWGVHGISTEQEGNLYVAEVDAGRFQKFRPRAGAHPATLIGKPVYSAWR